MWTLSGFADEIDPDLKTQCATLNDLGITHIEFRSAWDTNVLDLTDEQVDEAAAILAAHDLAVSSIGSPLGKIDIDDDFDAHLARADRALAVAQRLGAPFIRIFSFFLRPDQAPEQPPRRGAAADGRARRAAAPPASCCCTRTRRTSTATSPTACSTSSSRSARRPCGWPGTRPTSCRWASPRSPTGTRSCARTPSTCRSRTRCWPTGDVVPAGEGDGQVRETVRALAADGFDGFFSMEPHLGSYNELGALSGPANFTRATRAFTAILDSEGIEVPVRHPLSTTSSGRACEGAVAVGDVDGFVVGHALGQAVPEDLQPAVAQGAQGGVVAFPGGDLLVVELAGPAAAGEAAEGPLVHRRAEVAVVRQPAGHDEVALAGTAGDRGLPGVALQPVRGVELVDVLADLAGHPSCQTVSQAGEAQVDRPAWERLPRVGVLTVWSRPVRRPPSSSSAMRASQPRRASCRASSWTAASRIPAALARTR